MISSEKCKRVANRAITIQKVSIAYRLNTTETFITNQRNENKGLERNEHIRGKKISPDIQQQGRHEYHK